MFLKEGKRLNFGKREIETSELPRWLCQTRPAAMNPSGKKKKIPVQVLHFLGNTEAVCVFCSTRIPTLKRSFLRTGLDS